MVAESKRMNQERFPNKKFRSFINITQLMIFSNNMEYDTMGGIALTGTPLLKKDCASSVVFHMRL